MFANFIGKTMEVYIDDILMQLVRANWHLEHLQQAFRVLEEYNMKLNPAKCSFGVTVNKFVSYLVSKRGI